MSAPTPAPALPERLTELELTDYCATLEAAMAQSEFEDNRIVVLEAVRRYNAHAGLVARIEELEWRIRRAHGSIGDGLTVREAGGLAEARKELRRALIRKVA